MRFLFCLLMTATAAAARDGQPVLEVFVPAVFGIEMNQTVQRARVIVNEIYSGIGVRVVWRSIGSAPHGCEKEPLHRKIVVAFQTGAPSDVSREALAYANPYQVAGPCVTLLMDRLESAARLNPIGTGYLLGHVVAHEIGHVLQGFGHHSEAGVMKHHWSISELRNMPGKALRFTVLDSELIRDGFASDSGDEKVRRPRDSSTQLPGNITSR